MDSRNLLHQYSCKDLIAAAHQKQIPVFFTVCAYEEHLKDAGVWGRKVPALSWLKAGTKWVEIDPRLGKTPEDITVVKKYPSGFFGTHLQATLTSMGIDTLIITGCTTSGCVRATCIDALQYGYHGIVPEECVGDRAEAPHLANLFDIRIHLIVFRLGASHRGLRSHCDRHTHCESSKHDHGEDYPRRDCRITSPNRGARAG